MFLHNDDLVNRPSVVTPFDAKRLSCGAYELSLGSEAFMTNEPSNQAKKISEDGIINIMPGQFALLMTSEEVYMPADLIGFISIKAKIKFRGLINVSGFHVDPGFKGKLKFSVFNAGANPVILRAGDPTFLIWFSQFTKPFDEVDKYHGKHINYITPDDIYKIRGDVVSINSLKKDVEDLTRTMTIIKTFIYPTAAIIITLIVFLLNKVVH